MANGDLTAKEENELALVLFGETAKDIELHEIEERLTLRRRTGQFDKYCNKILFN